MSIFKKSDSVDVLDLTKLQKKGLLKLPEQKTEPIKVNSQGYVDLGISVLPVSESVKEAPSYNPVNDGAGALGFLDSLANVSASPEPIVSAGSDIEIQGLKNKIEDLEYKLRVLEDKISKLGG